MLFSQLKSAEERNVELKFEIDKLRKDKKEMMLKSEGLSAEQMDVQERDINMLKSLIKQERAVHKEEMERLNSKLRWYTQNQEMVDRDAAILEEQSKLIAKLRAQLNARGGTMDGMLAAADTVPEEHRNKSSTENKKWVKKVKDLEVRQGVGSESRILLGSN